MRLLNGTRGGGGIRARAFRRGATGLLCFLLALAGPGGAGLGSSAGTILSGAVLAGAVLSGCADTTVTESPAAPRAPVVLTAEVDKAEATTGDLIHYTVTLDRDPAIPVEMPEVFSRIEGLKVADIKEEGPVTRDGRVILKRTFELRADEVGSYVLPPLEVKYKDLQGKELTAGAPQIFVEVKTVLKEGEAEEDIVDIKPAIAPPVDYRRLALLGGGIVAGLGLLGGLAYYLRRRRRAVEPPAPLPPPWESALQALAALEARDLIRSGDARTHCYELSEIFRRYLELRFRFPALEETTEEILASFRGAAVPSGKPQDLARRVLIGTDRAKFAKEVPTPAEAEELMSAARGFIEATTPAPPPLEATSPAPSRLEAGKERA